MVPKNTIPVVNLPILQGIHNPIKKKNTFQVIGIRLRKNLKNEGMAIEINFRDRTFQYDVSARAKEY